MVSLTDIRQVFRGAISLSEPLALYTAFRVGGPADYYLEPQTKDDLVRLVNYFQGMSFPFILLGRGDNLLVSDEGYRGAVISTDPALLHVRMEGQHVYAGAGAAIARFVDFCVHRSLKGSEALAGAPGTLGKLLGQDGSAFDGAIADFLLEVEVLSAGNLKRRTKKEAKHRHEASTVAPDILIGAWFAFPAGDKEDLLRLRRERLVRWNAIQPVNIPKVGVMFKSPAGQHAAELIERAGMRGVSQGGAVVSMRHANLIVNAQRATAEDMLAITLL
jgi:UDP-N-acetylmuramate dehydrogenase